MGRKAGIVILTALLGLVLGLLGQGSGGLPELHLQKIVLEPPSPVVRGQAVAVHAWVMNTGGRPAGEFKVEFFYRPRGGESWISFYLVVVPNLPPSRQEALEIKDDGRAIMFDTAGLEPGTYEIRVVADSNDQIPEEDETNNELVTTLTVLPSRLGMPDLQPVALEINPPSPTSGQLVVVSVELRNTGDKDAGPFRVAFLVDGQEFDSATLEGLAAGASVLAQGALDPYALSLEPGSHKLLVIVDADDRVEEQDEANNELAASLTIQGAELHPTSLQVDRPLLRLDGRATIFSKIINTGKGVAGTVEVGFYIDGMQFALAQIGPLAAGEEALARGELIPSRPELGLAPGTHEIRVIVDPNDLIPELDEANNELARALTILPPEPKLPELHPQSLELSPPSPVELRTAEVVLVASVIRNTGKAPAEGFAVEFSYRAKGRLRWNPLPCRDRVSCSGLTLAPGAELRVEGSLAIATMTPGIYEIRVVVDPPLGGSDTSPVEELDETNNELVTTLTLLSPRLADLTFDPTVPLEVAPAYQVNRGQTIRFTANVVNLGDLDAGPFEVEFSYCRLPEIVSQGAPDQPCTEPTDFVTFSLAPLSGLKVGKRTQAQAILETGLLRPGSYLIRISIDPVDPSRPGGQVEEQSEVNNLLDITVIIRGADLIPIDLQLEPPSPVVQGQVVEVAATILNTGVEPTGKFDVNFSWCRMVGETSCARESEFISFGGVSFPGIAVNNPETVARELDTSALEPGEYLLRVVVDPDDRVEEQNEANNELTTSLQVERRPADLRPKPWLVFEPQPPVPAGQPVKVHGEIVNDGGTATGGFRVAFLYRRVEGGMAYEFSEFDSVPLPGLAPGEQAEVLGVLDTSELEGGTYEICILADADDKVRELDETNNLYCTPPPFVLISPPPDLQPKPKLRFEPETPVPAGQPVKVHAEVVNTGGSPAGKFSVAFLYHRMEEGVEHEYVQFDSVTVPGLAPEEQREVLGVFDTSGLAGGVYEICVVVDPDDFIEELDETNNLYCTPPPFVVIGPPAGQADLAPIDLEIKPSPILRQGQTAHVVAVVVNRGEGPAGPFVVQFFYRYKPRSGGDPEPVLFAAKGLSGLEVGERITLEVNLTTSDLPYGGYTITVVVDGEDQVRELNETNNRMELVMTII